MEMQRLWDYHIGLTRVVNSKHSTAKRNLSNNNNTMISIANFFLYNNLTGNCFSKALPKTYLFLLFCQFLSNTTKSFYSTPIYCQI